ncbi:hypothetical protein OKW33_003513 [Paraburkholderia atlantica]
MFIASISFSMSRARLIFASRRRLIRLWQQESKRTSSSEVPCSLKAEKVVCASGSDTSASGRSCNPMRRSGTSANRGRSVFSFETSRADSGPRSPLTVRATLTPTRFILRAVPTTRRGPVLARAIAIAEPIAPKPSIATVVGFARPDIGACADPSVRRDRLCLERFMHTDWSRHSSLTDTRHH